MSIDLDCNVDDALLIAVSRRSQKTRKMINSEDSIFFFRALASVCSFGFLGLTHARERTLMISLHLFFTALMLSNLDVHLVGQSFLSLRPCDLSKPNSSWQRFKLDPKKTKISLMYSKNETAFTLQLTASFMTKLRLCEAQWIYGTGPVVTTSLKGLWTPFLIPLMTEAPSYPWQRVFSRSKPRSFRYLVVISVKPLAVASVTWINPKKLSSISNFFSSAECFTHLIMILSWSCRAISLVVSSIMEKNGAFLICQIKCFRTAQANKLIISFWIVALRYLTVLCGISNWASIATIARKLPPSHSPSPTNSLCPLKVKFNVASVIIIVTILWSTFLQKVASLATRFCCSSLIHLHFFHCQ